MAVDLIITLNDAEQARVSQWLDLLKPGLTNGEKKTLLETLARKVLRDELLSRVNMIRAQGLSAQDAADRQAVQAVDPLALPAPVVPPTASPAP